MTGDWNEKIIGTYIDRTIKIIRQQYTLLFKDLGLDITTEQWVILDGLHHNDGATQNQLANASFKNAPTVSRIIDLLCKKGYTERRVSNKDKRKSHIFLTDLGREVYQTAVPGIVALREKGWHNLSDDDYEQFLRIINQVYTNYDE